MSKLPKEYRQEIYAYVEELLGRQLTFDEHDTLRDMMIEYVFSMRSMRMALKRTFCLHDWRADKQVEGGKRPLVHVKCARCDKRTKKKMPTITTA